MSFIPINAPRRSFNLGNAVAGFLLQPELPFSQILTQERIARVFARHAGTFGRTYTTAIVLWAFMGQVLRDGKEASCQSAVSRIVSFLQIAGDDEVDPDTRDYCRARAKLSEAVPFGPPTFPRVMVAAPSCNRTHYSPIVRRYVTVST